MKALFLVAEGFEDLELFYPLYRLQEEGIEVVVAGSAKQPFEGKRGYKITPQKTFEEINPSDYGMLVIPGGKSPERVRLSPEAVGITKYFFEKGLAVGAICHGIQVLISAGVMKGKRATCYEGVRDDLKAAGGIYGDKEVVVDKNLVTSRMPSDLPAFMRELMKKAGLKL